MKHLLCLLVPLLLVLLPTAALSDPAMVVEDEVIAWFDDALFVGDSLTRQLHSLMLKRGEAQEYPLGQAQFLTAHSYMIYNASRRQTISNEVNLRYRGKAITFEQALLTLQPGKLLLMLGLNDGAWRNLDKQLHYYSQVLDIAREALPEALIVVQPLTPVTSKQQAPGLQQVNIDRLNEALQALCAEKGVAWLDVATPLKGPDGLLPLDLASDTKVHLNERGLAIWLDSLYEFARQQLAQRENAH